MGAVDSLYSPDLKFLLCAEAEKKHLVNEATGCFWVRVRWSTVLFVVERY